MESVIFLLLVIVPGVCSGPWQVKPLSQCALRGTTVVIGCTYDYPDGVTVQSVRWFKVQSEQWWTIPLQDVSGRFQYLGNKLKKCSLQVNNVQHADWGYYIFEFVTTVGYRLGQDHARLTIRDLTAAVTPTTVSEGDEVRLSCQPGCPSLRPNVTWSKDGQQVSESVFRATVEDAGRYSCAVVGEEASRSASVALDVQYRPKDVSLALNSSSVTKGASLRLTCSARANPAVRQSGYSVYRGEQLIGSGRSFTLSNIQPAQRGRYHCRAWNGISWKGLNVSKSPEVQLDVVYAPERVLAWEDPVDADGSVTLRCSSDANPAAHNYTWYRRAAANFSTSALLVGWGRVLSLSPRDLHAGLYLCQAKNPLGEKNSTEILLEVPNHDDGPSLPVLAAIGLTLLLILILALLWFWKRTKQEDKQILSKSTSSRTAGMQNNPIYGNMEEISLTDTLEIPLGASQSEKTRRLSKAEKEIIYATVTIAPRRNTNRHQHTAGKACVGDIGLRSEEDASVIYSTVAQCR